MFRWLNTLATTITLIRNHKWGAEPQSEITLPPGEAFEASNTVHDYSVPGVPEVNPEQDPEQIAAYHEERMANRPVPALGGFEPLLGADGTPIDPTTDAHLKAKGIFPPAAPVGGIATQTGDAPSDPEGF